MGITGYSIDLIAPCKSPEAVFQYLYTNPGRADQIAELLLAPGSDDVDVFKQIVKEIATIGRTSADKVTQLEQLLRKNPDVLQKIINLRSNARAAQDDFNDLFKKSEKELPEFLNKAGTVYQKRLLETIMSERGDDEFDAYHPVSQLRSALLLRQKGKNPRDHTLLYYRLLADENQRQKMLDFVKLYDQYEYIWFGDENIPLPENHARVFIKDTVALQTIIDSDFNRLLPGRYNFLSYIESEGLTENEIVAEELVMGEYKKCIIVKKDDSYALASHTAEGVSRPIYFDTESKVVFQHNKATVTIKGGLYTIHRQDKDNGIYQLEQFTLCGIPIQDLTPDQKKLYDKYKDDPESMSKLQNIIHNSEKGQFEFLEVKLALADKGLIRNVTKAQADEAVAQLGDNWRLPRDVDYTEATKKQLNPELSDYDAMVICMPGETDVEKVENFRLLTGMYNRYRTSQSYERSNSRFVARGFDKKAWEKRGFDDVNSFHVRPVRLL